MEHFWIECSCSLCSQAMAHLEPQNDLVWDTDSKPSAVWGQAGHLRKRFAKTECHLCNILAKELEPEVSTSVVRIHLSARGLGAFPCQQSSVCAAAAAAKKGLCWAIRFFYFLWDPSLCCVRGQTMWFWTRHVALLLSSLSPCSGISPAVNVRQAELGSTPATWAHVPEHVCWDCSGHCDLRRAIQR